MKAIILAAGLGSRLRPITDNIPKSLVEVNNKPLIETQIEYLNEIGIYNIIIVVGYLHDKFSYLISKYNVELIFNPYYQNYNNIYTMSLVVDYLPNSYVIDADVYMCRNFLQKNIVNSTYFGGEKNTINEWKINFDINRRVDLLSYSNGYDDIMSGVSYWSNNDALFLKDKLLEKMDSNPDTWMNLYWDDIVKENINDINVFYNEISSDDWYEVDTLDDYSNLIKLYPNI